MSHKRYVSVAGSARQPVSGARRIGPADPDEHFDVTVVLRPRASAAEGRVVSREEFAASYGANPADIKRVERFAAEHGLQVTERSLVRRTVVLSGTAGDMARAFDVDLGTYVHPSGATYRGRIGEAHLPADLAKRVVAVLGLDNRLQARAHMRILGEAEDVVRAAAPRAAGGAFTPPELAKLYDFPSDHDGSGECIAIIELGGGFRQRDITSYFSSLGLTPPVVKAVSVDNGRNSPSTPSGADGEVMLDIEVAGAVAPGARLAVYFAPNTTRGFLDAITTATHDTINRPSVISISWGGPEDTWTAQTMQAMDQAFADAAAVGVTVYCAAGDSGSSDGEQDGEAHVDFPASSPHVVACGGTNLAGSSDTISREVVWQTNGATGGGVSDVFPMPSWQTNADVPSSANPPGNHRGRGVPDVAGDADPATGYVVRVDGRTMIIGGTSAVAPLWAGLTALLNQALGKPIGFVNPALYALIGDGAFHDITSGGNGAYTARRGWDACTGLGSPVGRALLTHLKGVVSGHA